MRWFDVGCRFVVDNIVDLLDSLLQICCITCCTTNPQQMEVINGVWTLRNTTVSDKMKIQSEKQPLFCVDCWRFGFDWSLRRNGLSNKIKVVFLIEFSFC